MEAAHITAIYPDRDRAERAAVRLREEGFPRAAVRVADPRSDAMAAWAEQRAESETYTKERGILTNKVLWFGAVVGAMAGIMLGSIVGGLTILMTEEAPLSDGGFMLASIIAGFAAGSTAGALIGAFDTFQKQRVERDQEMATDAVVDVDIPSLNAVDRVQAILEETGPRHIERRLPPDARRVV